MECTQCGGNRFRRRPRAGFLQDAVSTLGFAVWECRTCRKMCVVRQNGLAMVAEEQSGFGGRRPVRATPQAAVKAQGESDEASVVTRPMSPSYGYLAPRPVPVR